MNDAPLYDSIHDRSPGVSDLNAYGARAVIAGGSEGVGAEFARMLAPDGFNLVLIAHEPGPLQETAQKCRDPGVQARAISVDLLDPASVTRIAEASAGPEVGLHLYNAGASTCNEPFLEADLADFQKVIDLNVTRTTDLVQLFDRPTYRDDRSSKTRPRWRDEPVGCRPSLQQRNSMS